MGSAGCQPAPLGSLPGGISSVVPDRFAADVCGKLPQTAGWQPALPGLIFLGSRRQSAFGLARMGSFLRTARGFTFVVRFMIGFVIRKMAAIMAWAFGFQISP
jgi:hypothetical protein